MFRDTSILVVDILHFLMQTAGKVFNLLGGQICRDPSISGPEKVATIAKLARRMNMSFFDSEEACDSVDAREYVKI